MTQLFHCPLYDYMASGQIFLQNARVLITRHARDEQDTVRITLYTDPLAIRAAQASLSDEISRDILLTNLACSATALVNLYIGKETGYLYINLYWDMRATDDLYVTKYNWVRCIAPRVTRDITNKLVALKPLVNHDYFPWFDCNRPMTRHPGLICDSNPVVNDSEINLWSLKNGESVYDPKPCLKFFGKHYTVD